MRSCVSTQDDIINSLPAGLASIQCAIPASRPPRVRRVFPNASTRFLKLADCVEGGAQVAIINADGTGFQELTSGTREQRVPFFLSRRPPFRLSRVREHMPAGLRIMDTQTKSPSPP